MGKSGQHIFTKVYHNHIIEGEYSSSKVDCGHRALTNLALHYISLSDNGRLAQQQFRNANNMTQQLSALGNLLKTGNGKKAIANFYKQWQHERLVVDKWFSIQVTSCDPENAVMLTTELLRHPEFTLKNPNRLRALLGSLAMTPAAFHQPDGSAYNLIVDQLIALDNLNPQLCARMITVFETWKRYDEGRQSKIKSALNNIAQKSNLSRDANEILTRLLTE